MSEAKLITPLSIWPWFLQRCLIFWDATSGKLYVLLLWTAIHIVLSQPYNIVTREDFFVYFKKPPLWNLHFLSRDTLM